MRIAIEQAIDDGAKIVKNNSFFVTIDGIFLQRNCIGGYAVVLNFDSEKIAKIFKPSKDELKKMAKQKRAELEGKRAELEKIEKLINNLKQ